MQSKLLLFAAAILVILLNIFCCASAELAIGVKAGDWIEYEVTYTGIPAQGHNVVWARMEVLSVSGLTINLKITSRFEDNTTTIMNYTLNLQTGDLIDDFIIPANLTAGQTFIDRNLGDVVIQNVEQHTYAGMTRTVISTSTPTNTYVWDQKTGVSVEGSAQEPTYSLHTVIADTNMWQPVKPAKDVPKFAVLVISISIIVITSIGLVAHFRKNHSMLEK